MHLAAAAISALIAAIECANYDRYDTTYRYPSSTYNPFLYKTGSYGSDIAEFPDVTRYPNYSPGYSTSRFPGSYSTGGYTTPRYNNMYNGVSNNYNQRMNGGYGGQQYGMTGIPTGGYSSYEAPFVRDLGSCMNRSPQHGIWVDQLMGIWYGVELVQHLGMDTHVDQWTRTCIVVHISEPKDRPSTENQLYHVQHINAKFRQEYRHLRLLWDEAGSAIEYPLYFKNDSTGYWHAFDGQNGSLTNLGGFSYQQFRGTVQVLKAVHDHLLLNFCEEPRPGRPAQLFSILLSRTPGDFNPWAIGAIHSLLQQRNLSVASRRMVCGNNSGERPLYSIVFSLLTCLIAYAVGSS